MTYSNTIQTLLKTYGHMLYGKIISSVGPINITELALIEKQCLTVLAAKYAYNLNYHDGEYTLILFDEDDNEQDFTSNSLLETLAEAVNFINSM